MQFDPVVLYRSNIPIHMKVWEEGAYVQKNDTRFYASFADMAHMVLTPSEWEVFEEK